MWQSVFDFLSFKNYNSNIVIFALVVYGIGGGILGVYMMLSKRSMISDAFSHATLPGVVVSFLIASAFGGFAYRSIWVLLLGAIVSAFFSLLIIVMFRSFTFLKNDALFGIVISIFFGVGITLMSIANKVSAVHASGLLSYIYGNPTSLLRIDTYFFLMSSSLVLFFVLFFRRKLLVSSFDPHYGLSIGIPTRRIDFVLLCLTLLQTIVGIQAMGIILVSAILIVPPVSARFWSHSLRKITSISVLFCVLSTLMGGMISSVNTNLPAGASIILVAEFFFILSLLFGTEKGVVKKIISQFLYRIKIMKQHLMRNIYEYLETEKTSPQEGSISSQELFAVSGLSRYMFHFVLSRLKQLGFVSILYQQVHFTEKGFVEAMQFVKNHRLWELYLIENTYASVEDVDFSADTVEHVISKEHALELEKLLNKKYHTSENVLKSPHRIPR